MKTTNDYCDLVKLIKPEKAEPTLECGSKFYIPFKGKDVEFVIIGKDVNPNPDESGHFIDVMSTSLVLENIPWVNEVKNNNMDEGFRNLHYTRSNVIKVLEEQKQYLPEEIRTSIIPRKVKFLVGVDFVSGDLKYGYIDIGSIWLPSLKEVCGELRFSDDSPENEQYPYFKDDEHKQLGGYWWLRSTRAFDGWFACFVFPDVGCGFRLASDSVLGLPLCFRLKIND